ncbi:MAG: hypothetical protein ACR2LK_12685 [Solirubrobacteraceae bacterium]
MSTAPLPTETVDAIARRVVDLLREEQLGAPRLADASQLARLLGVERSWIYDHATQLGAIRLGDGPRGRLRFDVDRALAAWTQHAQPVEPAPGTPAPRRRAPRDTTALLPIRGREAA